MLKRLKHHMAIEYIRQLLMEELKQIGAYAETISGLPLRCNPSEQELEDVYSRDMVLLFSKEASFDRLLLRLEDRRGVDVGISQSYAFSRLQLPAHQEQYQKQS